MMTDPNLCQTALRRRSVSKRDNDPMNCTANLRIYPNQFIPSGRAESHPNVSGSGFIDEYPYTGPVTRLHTQRNRSEVRVAGVMERFGKLKSEINEWEILIKSHVISPDVINEQCISLSRVIQDLARVEFAMCGDISNYETK